MDIYTLIRNDHQKAKETIRKIQALTDRQHAERLKLFHPLKEELITHNDAEEQTFYVALEQHKETSGDAKHSETEHHKAAGLLDDLDDDDMAPAKWRAKFDAFCHDLFHHISKEESKIFEEARDVLSEKMAVQLAAEMETLKRQKEAMFHKGKQDHSGAERFY